jgi:OPT oligopeptide transporter protein
MAQALQFTSDFKLGHYMKIPPRAMFWSQIAPTVIAETEWVGEDGEATSNNCDS